MATANDDDVVIRHLKIQPRIFADERGSANVLAVALNRLLRSRTGSVILLSAVILFDLLLFSKTLFRSASHPRSSAANYFLSFSICIAALRPGAPMMPPPGCVAEPHMYRSRIGVRYCAQPGAGRKKKSCSSVSSP